MSGSDFRTVWARHGNAAAEKISPNAKARMFVVPPAGWNIISERDQKLHAAQNLFSHARGTLARHVETRTAGVKRAYSPDKTAGVKPAFVVDTKRPYQYLEAA